MDTPLSGAFLVGDQIRPARWQYSRVPTRLTRDKLSQQLTAKDTVTCAHDTCARPRSAPNSSATDRPAPSECSPLERLACDCFGRISSEEKNVTTTSTLMSISRKVAVSLVGLALFLAIQPRATAQSTTYVYAITDAGGLGTLNLSTGAWTQILGESKTVLGGLGVTGKILYGPQGNELYLLDQGNGQASAVGNLTGSLTCADFGSTTEGLYCLDSEMNLWLIATNGTATDLGSIGIMPPKCY